jgi:hypothetical protein
MAPRGLKKILKETAPCRLVGSGNRKRFELCLRGEGRGQALKGLTKRLEDKLFSGGSFPSIVTESSVRRAGWRGCGGGRRRGSAVDAQVSRLAGQSAAKRATARMLVLSRLVFAALERQGLESVAGQRAVCSQFHRVGTAADLVCHRAATNELVVVELKSGFGGSKTAAARVDGREATMRGPLRKAPDCVLNRHMLQLAVTHALFMRETSTLSRLSGMGIEGVDAALLYTNDDGVEFYALADWWKRKSLGALDALRA